MNKKDFYFSLFFVLALVGFVFSAINKLNNENTSSPLKKEKSLFSSNNGPKKNNKMTTSNSKHQDDAQKKTNKNKVILLSECIKKDLSSSKSLFGVAQQQGWTNTSTNKIVKRNFIYKKNGTEKRLHIVPEENSPKWRVQLFDVDLEGLPIPKERGVANNINEALALFERRLNGLPLESEETLIEVDQGDLSGSILTVQQSVAKIKLYDKKSSRVFECVSGSCACNSMKM